MKSAFLLLAATPAMWAQTSVSDAVLERARDRILEAIHSLPKYTCTQTVDRVYLAPAQAGMSRGGCDQIVANRQNGTAHVEQQETDRLRLDVEVADEGFEIYSWPGASRISTERVQDLVGEGSMGTGPFRTVPDRYLRQSWCGLCGRGREADGRAKPAAVSLLRAGETESLSGAGGRQYASGAVRGPFLAGSGVGGTGPADERMASYRAARGPAKPPQRWISRAPTLAQASICCRGRACCRHDDYSGDANNTLERAAAFLFLMPRLCAVRHRRAEQRDYLCELPRISWRRDGSL